MDGPTILTLLGLFATVASPFVYGWYERRRRLVSRGFQADTCDASPVPFAARVSSHRRERYPDFFAVETLPGGSRTYLREASPAAVVRAFATIPPLKQQTIGDELFKGHWVRWRGRVGSIWEGPGGDYCVVSVATDNEVEHTNLIIPESRRREIELLRVGDALRFEGQIARFTNSTPELVHVEFAVSESV